MTINWGKQWMENEYAAKVVWVLTNHHDDEDPDKDGNEISEEGEPMLDVVHVAVVRPLNDFLRVCQSKPAAHITSSVSFFIQPEPKG
jgi:hypothetical protein